MTPELRRGLVLAGGALVALLAAPFALSHRADRIAVAAAPTMAPVTADYLTRDTAIASFERNANRDPLDGLTPRLLGGQYLQRYRERGDVGDILRAEAAARRSLRAQPRGNVAADLLLSSALVDLHRFRDALAPVADAERIQPANAGILARRAGIDLELGRFDATREEIDRARRLAGGQADVAVVQARYDELTGHLDRARSEIVAPMQAIDSIFDAPAENRAWYHYRAGDLAFAAGDLATAQADYQTALQLYPGYWHAETSLARLYAGRHQWQASLEAAQRSAAFTPYPDALGYVVDAQRALGHPDDARRTDDLIRAIERIGNTRRTADRLLAIYYAEHRENTADALAIARRDVAVHDDLMGEDTLAWAAAADGRWGLARSAIARALRFDTEDAKMQYHAGAIALHFGDRKEAKRRFARALALNPSFHPVYADDARRRLATL